MHMSSIHKHVQLPHAANKQATQTSATQQKPLPLVPTTTQYTYTQHTRGSVGASHGSLLHSDQYPLVSQNQYSPLVAHNPIPTSVLYTTIFHKDSVVCRVGWVNVFKMIRTIQQMRVHTEHTHPTTLPFALSSLGPLAKPPMYTHINCCIVARDERVVENTTPPLTTSQQQHT